MATNNFIPIEPYSGTFSAGTFDIYPQDGVNHNPYITTAGTPVPYLYPIAYTTDSIGSSKDQTVYVSIQYYIPDINNTVINRGAMYYQLEGGSIPNAIIELQQDPVTASGYPLSATPYSISSIGAPYQTTHIHSPGTPYMCSNNESLILALVNTDPAQTQDFKLTDANVVSMISAPLYPGQSNIARTTITPTDEEIWAVLVYRADLVWAQSYKAIMFRDFKVQKYKSVTQISDKGVLIFNNPDQYVKFSSESNDDDSNSIQQHSIISVDTLKAHTIYADNIISDYNAPKGGDSPTGGGIQGLQYDGNRTIISDYTISAPAFSGSGFYLPDDYIPTTAFGHYSAGSELLKGKNLLQAIQSAFMYQSPYVSLVGDTPSITWGNATEKFITTAMNETKTWGQQYQLPAKFATTTVSVTYSGVSWDYKNPDNINWSTIGTSRLTSSIASTAGIMQSHTVLPATYFSSSAAGIAYSRGPVTYSVKFPKVDTVASSKNQSATLTPTQVWSGVKDTLNNAIAAPSGLTASAKSKTTKDLGRYGSRFLLAKRTSAIDNAILWKACDATSRTNITSIGNWTTFDQAFAAAVPYPTNTTAGINTLDLSFGDIFAGASMDTPISIFLIAPSGTNIYKTTTPTMGRYKNSNNANVECYLMGSDANIPGGTASHTTLTPFYLYGLNNVETDPKLACGVSNGSYTRTWPNSLESTTKLFFITALTTEVSSYPLKWDAS